MFMVAVENVGLVFIPPLLLLQFCSNFVVIYYKITTKPFWGGLREDFGFFIVTFLELGLRARRRLKNDDNFCPRHVQK